MEGVGRAQHLPTSGTPEATPAPALDGHQAHPILAGGIQNDATHPTLSTRDLPLGHASSQEPSPFPVNQGFEQTTTPPGEYLSQFYKDAKIWTSHHKSSLRSRDRAMGTRIQLMYHRQTYNDRCRHLAESQMEYMRVAGEVFNADMPQAPLGRLRSLYDNLCHDHEEAKAQAGKVSELEASVTRQEYRAAKKEDHLAEVTARLIEGMKRWGGPLVDTDLEDLDLSSSVSSGESGEIPSREEPPPPPSLLDLYFDRSGQVEILKERLHDIDMDHSEERERRNFLLDQDQNLVSPDDQFEREYESARKDAEQELTDAILRKDGAYLACCAEGIDPELARPSSPESFSASETDGPDPHRVSLLQDENTESPSLSPSNSRYIRQSFDTDRSNVSSASCLPELEDVIKAWRARSTIAENEVQALYTPLWNRSGPLPNTANTGIDDASNIVWPIRGTMSNSLDEIPGPCESFLQQVRLVPLHSRSIAASMRTAR